FLEDGALVQDVGRIRRHYLASTTFRWHVASLLPTELLALWPACPLSVPALRANRCLRAPRLLEALERGETRTGYPNAMRLAKLSLCLLGAIHCYGCLYFALSANLGLGTDGWVCPEGTSPLGYYLQSFYFATLVLTTVGDTPVPTREEEYLFEAAGFLLAVLGIATITGSVASLLANSRTTRATLHPDSQPLQRYLRAHGVAVASGQAEHWQRRLRAQQALPAEREVLRVLPPALRAEVAGSIHLPALRRVGLFQGWHEGVLRQLVLHLRPRAVGPGEAVCQRGEVGTEMFFVRDGHLVVLGDGGQRLALLGQGSYFGEISLLDIKGNPSGNRRTADIVSVGYSQLFCLGKEQLAEVLAEEPRARAALRARGRQLLLAAGKRDAGVEAAADEAERKVAAMERELRGLRLRAAGLRAQLEAGALRGARGMGA
ncbi:CNGA4 protein, partial [Rhinopomastus cyanomelas]|nr:CNGA4 protein [Rhinopomastus cyanomelas]